MTNIPTVVNPRAPKRMVGCELLNLAAHNPADLVQLSEQQYQSRIDAAAAYVLASGRRIVMLTGPSAAGKTTSANKLAAAMRSKGVRSRVLSLDDFFVGEGRYPKQPDGRDDYECVEALDIPLVQHCLQQLAQTGVCDAPIFDFMTQLPAPQTQHIDCTDGVVVVEGLSEERRMKSEIFICSSLKQIETNEDRNHYIRFWWTGRPLYGKDPGLLWTDGG